MRAGDVLNGYTILEDFKVVGAGLSKWTFAERGGRQFFIKEFLSPTYPDENAPGSEKTKAKKRARCAVFEAHHRGVQRALAPLSAYGGNLIVTLDFFRWGAKYYKVTEKVDAAGLSAADVRRLGLRTQLVLMKTVSHSLKILHDLKIVHSDLKPSNVLIKQTELGYTTKLIDFDSSYIAGRPPPPEEIVGTINYYSPELLGYIQEAGVTPAELGLASDVFALGLIYTEYLTGAPPPFDVARYHEPAVAVRSGERLRIPRGEIPVELADLVDAMLAPDPAQRPTIAQVHATLMTIRPEPERPVPSARIHRPSRQGPARGRRTRRRHPTASAEPAGRQARPEADRPGRPDERLALPGVRGRQPGRPSLRHLWCPGTARRTVAGSCPLASASGHDRTTRRHRRCRPPRAPASFATAVSRSHEPCGSRRALLRLRGLEDDSDPRRMPSVVRSS